MRAIKPSAVLEMLARIGDIVKELPDDARIGRMFIVDDGQGVVLERGIHKAAEVFGKTVETVPGFSPEWKFLRFKVGELTIFQITKEREMEA